MSNATSPTPQFPPTTPGYTFPVDKLRTRQTQNERTPLVLVSDLLGLNPENCGEPPLFIVSVPAPAREFGGSKPFRCAARPRSMGLLEDGSIHALARREMQATIANMRCLIGGLRVVLGSCYPIRVTLCTTMPVHFDYAKDDSVNQLTAAHQIAYSPSHTCT